MQFLTICSKSSCSKINIIAWLVKTLSIYLGSGKAESKSVLTCSLPVLLKTWLSCPEDARNQFLSSTSQLMVSAANTGTMVLRYIIW